MKSLNVRLVIILLVAGLVLGGGAYFLRAFNVHRTAKFRLDLATEEEVRAELARQRGDFTEAAEAYKEAVESLAWYVDLEPNDQDCPIKGMPSIRFDMRLSREGEADRTSGRVGTGPAAIMRSAKSGQAHAAE